MRELKFREYHDKIMRHFELYNAYVMIDINNVMQYTGLKDKNGKDELYQDDIVNVHYFYFDGTEAEAEMEGVLGWREFGLTLENIKGKNFESHTGYDESEGWIYLSNWSGLHEESFTLLGNIHENPEKLK